MKALVMGSGAVGGYFGGRLAQAGHDVTFVARGEHLRAIQESGLHIKSAQGDVLLRSPALEKPEKAGVVDLVLFTVKTYDSESAARLIKPCVGPDTVVLSLQNGIDAVEKIGAVVGEERVLPGAAYVWAVVKAPGVIDHSGGGRFVFGEPRGGTSPRAEAIVQAFAKGGVAATLSTDIARVLWEKYATVCANGLTASTRLTVGQIRSHPEARRLQRMVLEEVVALGRAAGVALEPGFIEHLQGVIDNYGADSRTSLYHDLAAGKRMEIEGLHGTAVRLGQRFGIPTPMSFAIYAHLRPWADLAEQKKTH
jgi:2-dehydropantoate 2-reductase